LRKLGFRNPGVRLFVNVSGRVLEDQAFLAKLVDFVRGHRALGNRMVLEAAAQDVMKLPAESREQLVSLSRLGFVFSIDHVTDLAVLDPAWLAGMQAQFLKIDAGLLLNGPCAGADRAQFGARVGEHRATRVAT